MDNFVESDGIRYNNSHIILNRIRNNPKKYGQTGKITKTKKKSTDNRYFDFFFFFLNFLLEI